jgi:hypothetical protein
MDYKARFYSPTLMRFTQLDTIVPQPGNPQSWNRYSYGLNNPVKYIDPSGHCYVESEFGGYLVSGLCEDNHGGGAVIEGNLPGKKHRKNKKPGKIDDDVSDGYEGGGELTPTPTPSYPGLQNPIPTPSVMPAEWADEFIDAYSVFPYLPWIDETNFYDYHPYLGPLQAGLENPSSLAKLVTICFATVATVLDMGRLIVEAAKYPPSSSTSLFPTSIYSPTPSPTLTTPEPAPSATPTPWISTPTYTPPFNTPTYPPTGLPESP